MNFTTVTKPGFRLSKQKKRKINLNAQSNNAIPTGGVDSFNSMFQVYRGRFDRMERYRVYDWMDNDTDISRALDLIAEQCTEIDDTTNLPFHITWSTDDTTEEGTGLVGDHLDAWCDINKMDQRAFSIVRNVLKYGDWFLFRDQDTMELYNLPPTLVLGAYINPNTCEVQAWLVKNFIFNTPDMEMVNHNLNQSGYAANRTGNDTTNVKIIPAHHIIHLTLSEGKYDGGISDVADNTGDIYSSKWPFAESWLEGVYKTFRQREMTEDAALIHRSQRASSKYVWYIDTGKARGDRADSIVNNFKTSLNQKRIPQLIGNTSNKTVDSVYNPISQLEDVYIPVSFENRGSKVETLEGQDWSDIPELGYFTKKMMRGLRVPHSWMLGPDEGGATFNDARVGTAYQEEITFSKFCKRMQRQIVESLNFEFKLYCHMRDVNVSPSDFDLEFTEPTNYEEFKNNARDQDNINIYQAYKDDPNISPRMALKKGMKWTDEEVLENERMRYEELNGTPYDDDGGFGGGGDGDFGGGFGSDFGDFGGDFGSAANDAEGGFGGEGGEGGFGGASDGLGGGGAPVGGGSPAGGAPSGGGFASAVGGGFGESDMSEHNETLMEEIDVDDLAPAPERGDKLDTEDRTPDDKLVLAKSKIKMTPLTTMETIRRLRMADLAKRVGVEKQSKIIQAIYAPPKEENASPF